MSQFHFVPSARLQQILGRELIADPNLAVSEFVKNAYDAGATDVSVDFELEGRSRGEQQLVIADNGVGMDEQSFEENWMHPGYSEKILPKRPLRRRPSRAESLRQGRIPIGEKGLGRLSAAHLGDRLEVFTRQRSEEEWLHALFDWSQFDDMSKSLAEIPIPYEFLTNAPTDQTDVGTIVVIRQLRLDWAGFIPGRKIWGRSDRRLGRLAEDFSILVQPLAPTQEEFRIHLGVDDAALAKRFGATFSPETPPPAAYAYKFRIKPKNRSLVIDRHIVRSEVVANKVEQPERSEESVDLSKEPELLERERRPASLKCGEFGGTFMYMPQHGDRWKEVGGPLGVFVYRDGVRVEPYGYGEDDWLGARQRKASRQGHAGIQPKQLYGYVSISRHENPDLIEMTNRQGLVENEAYEDFVAHARAEFRRFEDLVLEEYVEPSWNTPEQKVQEEAERARFFGQALVRTLLHSIRQPVSGLGSEMSTLESLVEEDAFPRGLGEEFESAIRRSKDHLHTLDDIVDRFVYFDEQSLTAAEQVRIDEVVKQAIERVLPLAESKRVTITEDIRDASTVIIPRHALLEAIYEVMANAVQAPRPEGVQGRVDVVTKKSANERLEILVIDNGSGVPLDVQDSLGTKMLSTKGRPGLGLILVRELLALFLASVHLVETSDRGSTFRISIPPVRRAIRGSNK